MLKKIALLTAALMFIVYQSWPLLTETPTYNDDQNNIYLLAMRRGDPSFLANDYAFGNPNFLKFYTPLYLDAVWRLMGALGSYDAAMITLHTVMLTLYLASMFILLRYVSGSSWLALGVTLFSALARPAIASEVWGAAGMNLVYPRTAFLAVAPLLFWLTFCWLPKPEWWRLAVLGLLGGLSANLHPPSGLFFAQILVTLVAAFACASLWELAWKGALVGVAALLGALPTFMPLLQNIARSSSSAETAPPFETIANIIHERSISIFPFPADQMMLPWGPLNATWQSYGAVAGLVLALGWVALALWHLRRGYPSRRRLLAALLVISLPLAYAASIFSALDLILVTIAYWVVRLARQNDDPLDRYALAVLACAAFYSFAGSGVLLWLWENLQIWALTSFYSEQARMARLLYLPFFIFVVRWLSLLLYQSRRREVGAVVSAGIVAGLVVRHWHFRDPWGVAEWGMGVSLLLVALAGIWCCFDWRWPNWAETAIFALSLMATTYLWLYILGAPQILLITAGVGAISGLLYFNRTLSIRQWRWVAGLIVAVSLGWLFAHGKVALYNERPLRVQAYKALGLFDYGPPDQQEQDAQAMYQWVKNNIPREARFYYNDRQLEFRAQTHRAVTHSWKDLSAGYYAPSLLVKYYNRFKALEAAYQSPEMLLACANAYQADYIVTQSGQPKLPLPVVFANQSYRIYFNEPTTNTEHRNCP